MLITGFTGEEYALPVYSSIFYIILPTSEWSTATPTTATITNRSVFRTRCRPSDQVLNLCSRQGGLGLYDETVHFVLFDFEAYKRLFQIYSLLAYPVPSRQSVHWTTGLAEKTISTSAEPALIRS
jgi:hypothetical protein